MKSTKQYLKKGVFVKVISGDDKGSVGEVLKVIKRKELILVKGLNLKKKHIKLKSSTEKTALWVEGPIHKSNVSLHNFSTVEKF